MTIDENVVTGDTLVCLPDGRKFVIRLDRYNDAFDLHGPNGFYWDGLRDQDAAIDFLEEQFGEVVDE